MPSIAQRLQALSHDLLQVRLADIDDVVDPVAMTECGMDPLSLGRRSYPDIARLLEMAVAEVPVEQAELPELVGDVLAGVGHRAVRADDDLVLVIPRSASSSSCITQQPLFLPSVSR